MATWLRVEAMLNQQQQAPAVAAAQPASEYTYSSPEFVGPPAPNVKAQPPVQVTVSVGGAVVLPPGATSGTWTTPGGTVAPQYAAIVQNNPSVALVPQTGTTPVPVTNQNMQSLMSLLTQGANAFTSSQILSVLAHAKSSGAPVYVPHAAVGKVKPAAKASDWWIAAGVGLAVLGAMTVFALRRK